MSSHAVSTPRGAAPGGRQAAPAHTPAPRPVIQDQMRPGSAFAPSMAPVRTRSPCACGSGCPSCSGSATRNRPAQRIEAASSPAERQADQTAERITGASAARTGQTSAPAAGGSGATPLSGAASGALGNLGAGQALSTADRSYFEPRLGRDLSDIRLHTDDRAERAATAVSARAFASGDDIAFAKGAYQPDTGDGRKLLAHELAHTAQQTDPGTLFRQEAEATGPVTAQEVFPAAVGDRFQLRRTLDDVWLGLMQIKSPRTAATLETIQNHVVEVTTISDDLFEATMSGSITLPAETEGGDAQQVSNIRLRFERAGDGTFSLSFVGQSGQDAAPVTLDRQSALTAERRDGRIVLSANNVPQLGVQSTEGGLDLQAYTAPYMADIPGLLRGAVKPTLDLLRLTRLDNVEAGSAEEQAAIEANAAQDAAQNGIRDQRLTLGGGFMAAQRVHPMLSASWQINLIPSRVAGGFAQIPINISLQYAPTSSVLARATAGFETSLSQLDVPINIRILAGLGGGSVRETDPLTGEPGPARPVFGMPIGGGLGVELDNFRIDLRYDYLLNFLDTSDGVHTLGAGFGGAF